MATLSLPVGVRPARIGFLVEGKSPPDVLRAINLASGLWGGIHDFVIPIDDPEAAERQLEELSVDMIVPSTKSSTSEDILDKFPHLRWHSYATSHPLITTGMKGATAFTLVDTSLSAYQHWWDEGRHSTKARAFLPEWPLDHPRAMFFAALFGAFPIDGNDIPNQRSTFERAFAAQLADVAREAPSAEWIELLTPITSTRLGLRLWSRYGRPDAGLVVGDPTRVDHLLAFWNLRASGARILFCPSAGPDTWEDYYRAHLEREAIPREEFNGERAATFWRCIDHDPTSSPAERPEVDEAILDLAPSDAKRLLATLDTREPAMTGLDVRAQTDSITVLASMEDRFGTKYVTISPEFPFDQARRQLGPKHQQWFVCLRPYSMLDLAEGWTMKIPNVPRMNDWYSREMTFSTGDVRVQDEGFDILAQSDEETINYSPVRVQALVSEIFSRAGIEMSVSTPGHIAFRIVEMFEHRRQAALLRIRGVQRLLSSTEARKGIPFSRAVQLVVDKDPITKTSSFDLFRSYWRTSPEDLVRSLIAWEALRPGLRLKCPNCALDVLIDIDRIGNKVDCPMCTNTFLLGPRLTGKEWVLRVSGVFEREGGPQGAIPTLLAWGELERTGGVLEELFLLPAHNLKGSELACETDLIALQVAPLTRFPSICIGECKTHATIEEGDLTNLAEVRRRLRDSGVECHILFATLRDSYETDELSMLASFAEECAVNEDSLGTEYYVTKEASPLILLTSRDFEADPWHSKPAHEGVPNEYPHSFNDLAENSRVAYLDVPLGVRYVKRPELLAGGEMTGADNQSPDPESTPG